MTDEHLALEDGWHRHTPAGDSVLRDFVDSSARYVTTVGRAVGAVVVDDDEIAGAHHGTGFPFANLSIVRQPLAPDAWPDVIDRLRGAFPPGLPFVVASPFATPDLVALGAHLIGHPPFMVRPPGPPAAAPTLAGFTIDTVSDRGALAEFEATLITAYPAAPGGSLFTEGILTAPDVTLWLARLDGRPVATAAGHHGGMVNGVEIISCLPEIRGRGIGEAITWMPTLARPEHPGALIASDSGRPVYTRMGYIALLRFTLWLVS